MKILKQIFGICKTETPADRDCWNYSDNRVTLGLNRALEILRPGGAIRLEGKGLPVRILLFHGLDGMFYAVKNRCTHIGGRRLDAGSQRDRLTCCSVMGSVFNYKGEVVSGPARKPLTSYTVAVEKGRLVIDLSQETKEK